MRADLRALGGVERALEQRAEDRRLDVGPVVGVDFDRASISSRRQLDRRRASANRPPLNQGISSAPKSPPVGHGVEEHFKLLGQPAGFASAPLQQLAEQLVRAAADILAEHAEHQLHEEMGRRVRLDAALTRIPSASIAESFGRLLGDALGGEAGA